MIAPDDTTFAYLEGRPGVPEDFDAAVATAGPICAPTTAHRSTARSSSTPPRWRRRCHLGHEPRAGGADRRRRAGRRRDEGDERRALRLHGSRAGTPIAEIAIDRVFLGSCTNGRIEDLRAAARSSRGRKVADSVRAMVVPGSVHIKAQAETEGLDDVFRAAGFEWRERRLLDVPGHEPGHPGARRALRARPPTATSKAGRARGGRTHLVSPAMAAAAAVTGRLTDVRELVGA